MKRLYNVPLIDSQNQLGTAANDFGARLLAYGQNMQFSELKHEFNKARWGIDIIVCIVTAVSLPLLFRLLTFPLEATPLVITKLLTSVAVITFLYLLSSVIGKWVLRIRSKSFLWTPVAGALLCAITQAIFALPSAIEYYSRFVQDKSLIRYLIGYSVPGIIFIVLVLGGFSLASTVAFRLLFAIFSHDSRHSISMP